MKMYLLSLSVVTRHRSWIDRAFGTCDGPVTAQIIARWEKEAAKAEYRSDEIVQVFAFRELGA